MRVLTPAHLDEAARLLGGGRLVAVPTDTVYGLAAALDDDLAVGALFTAKRRPDGVPVAVLCGSTEEAASIATRWDDRASRLAARFWPGPLTIVVEADDELVRAVRATRGVGVRVPDDETILALLARTGPLAVTSANLHGEPPATAADEVITAFEPGVVDAIVDDGRRDGAVSTVVDLAGDEVAVLREGAIAAHAIVAALSEG